MKRLDLVGQKFGRLTVISYAGAATNGNARWNCQCDCGNTAVVDGYRLRKGMTTSCGCYRREYMKKAIMANPKTRAQMGQRGQFDDTEGVNVAAATKLRATNRSGVIGVSFDRQTAKWNARLFLKGKLVLNKQFVDFQAAVDARKAAEKKFLDPILQRTNKSND
ncbi:alcohol dehydrogenase [Lacticaseibacillus sp. N501-2]|uniref:alcohol dehydrogenase n=1 Tax=Lacticaseibacillus salsurae TaxID=3367729 RepID=UPI0038B3953B